MAEVQIPNSVRTLERLQERRDELRAWKPVSSERSEHPDQHRNISGLSHSLQSVPPEHPKCVVWGCFEPRSGLQVIPDNSVPILYQPMQRAFKDGEPFNAARIISMLISRHIEMSSMPVDSSSEFRICSAHSVPFVGLTGHYGNEGLWNSMELLCSDSCDRTSLAWTPFSCS